MSTPNHSSSVILTECFAEALELAFRLHREQRRKGSGVPYVAHLLAVAALVLEDGGDEDEAIAALLHDAVEDHPERITREGIRARFGERVAALVDDCTDTPADYAGGLKPAWRPRKEAYLRHLRQGPAGLRISLADKVHNARAILADHQRVGEAVWDRFSATKQETLWYYRALVDAFREAGATGYLLGELEMTVAEMERRSAG
jgi:(p)ppGpp synthase/HD superfamily hydrolase